MISFETNRLIELLDASYNASEDATGWARGVLAALLALAGSRAGASFHYASTYEAGDFHLQKIHGDIALGASGPNPQLLHALVSWRGPGNATEQILARTQGSTASGATGLGSELARSDGWRKCWPGPVLDSLGLVTRDTNGKGFCVFAGLDRVESLTLRERRLLGRIAVHVGAGDRLRRKKAERIEAADAILTPAGKLLHAAEIAVANRDSLEEGLRRRAAARTKKNDPAHALELWRGLVAGRWSIVDHFDTDGKRLLLAMKNAPATTARADLTPRERRVSALVAMGHRDKEIAYMLGLSSSAVSAAFFRARTKLRMKSRVEFAREWRKG